MKLNLAFVLSLLLSACWLAVSSSSPAGAAAEAPKTLDGKQIFLAQKCSLCHTVSSAGIEATTKSEKMKGPDLTELGPKLEAPMIRDYLHKKTEIHGKKHGKMFTGSDAELDALIAWLQKQAKP
jgi:mono/diheme cytochrome c family protein